MMSCVNTSSLMSAHRTGQIQVIFGPMFSGKTTELMRRMKRYLLANYRCLVIKYAKDTRYDADHIATHDRQLLQAKAATTLNTLHADALSCDVIGIDEGQFFVDVVEFSERMADLGKTVIVAALDGDFQRKGFGSILQLVPLAESVIKLTAVCMSCYGEASFTKRKTQDKQLEMIGGTEMYLAVCRACYKPPCSTSPLCSPARHTEMQGMQPRGDPAPARSKLFASTSPTPLQDRTNSMDTNVSS